MCFKGTPVALLKQQTPMWWTPEGKRKRGLGQCGEPQMETCWLTDLGKGKIFVAALYTTTNQNLMDWGGGVVVDLIDWLIWPFTRTESITSFPHNFELKFHMHCYFCLDKICLFHPHCYYTSHAYSLPRHVCIVAFHSPFLLFNILPWDWTLQDTLFFFSYIHFSNHQQNIVSKSISPTNFFF